MEPIDPMEQPQAMGPEPKEPLKETPPPELKQEPSPSQVKLPSPQERLELILLGLIREQTVERLCQQAGVSKALFYQWMRRGREGLLQALEAKKPGRKPLQKLQQDPEKIQQLQERLKRLERETGDLRKERDRLELMLQVAQRVIQRNGWKSPEPARRRNKKKDTPMEQPNDAILDPGATSEAAELPPPPLPECGESAGAPITDGSSGDARGDGLGLG